LRAIDAEPALSIDVSHLRQGTAPNRPAPTPSDLHDLTTYTPPQTHWPIRVLGEAVTTYYGRPALEAMVLTRRGPHSSWRVALDTNVIGNATFHPTVQAPILDAAGFDYNILPPLAWISPDAVVPALARYWQSLRETGRPPEGGVVFSPGYWTTDYGEKIARTQDKPDSRNGIRAHVDYGDRPTPPDEVWTFGVDGDWTLVCSPMHETKSWAGGTQDRDRQKWGWDLPPGSYDTIASEFVRTPCLIVPPASGPPGVVVFGADAWEVATRGTR